MEIKKIALIGLGAIGTVYGSLLHQKYGSDFAVIAGESRGEKLRAKGVTLNGQTWYPHIVSPREPDYRPDLIVICVKNYQLDQAITDLRGIAGKDTVLLPLLNGVTARDRLLAAFPENPVLYGLSIRIDAVRLLSGVVNTVNGEIQFGFPDNTVPAPEVTAVRDALTAAGIEAEVCPDMLRAVWKKWMLNVGCNQVSAVTGSTYGQLAAVETSRILFHEAMQEVVALAKAARIDLTERDAQEFEAMMKDFSPHGKTSMLQDVEAKRQTEVDYFAGTVVELGSRYHVPTPVNHVLYCVIRSMEANYSKKHGE